ncbi:helix-turn-helix domain-containing protein [Nitrosococcus halophilus]|uniref:helix-turn-helix domain-containing protein n=1 Tax=Nitrosococcus halophilus TaxID=133539 RepID=UPI001EF0D00F|nr:helix-turn-helix domain-containing protein [Nitrosococcus halophilus]
MLLAHKIELRPSISQAAYLDKACGSRRHCYNKLLEHFSKDENKWSKAAAYQHYIKVIRSEFPWYSEVSSRVTRNAIDDLDNAFKHFFRRVKKGEKPGFPKFKKKDINDSFSL